MKSELTFRHLSPKDLEQMYRGFLDAFSDYKVPFRLSKDQFVKKFVEKLKLDFSHSVGVFDDKKLVGFIFTAINNYEGRLTAYNGGTGVRPAYRGQQLTLRMYDFIIPFLKEKGVKQCVLEVLTENQRAIKAYSHIGFKKTKYYKCFKLLTPLVYINEPSNPIEIFPVQRPNWLQYERFADQHTSFLDSPEMINSNLANEMIIEAHGEGSCWGYAVFQPAIGRISQIGVDPQYRRRGVGSALISYIHSVSYQKSLSIINIQDDVDSSIYFFQSLGFINQLNQYEMILTLD